MPAGEQPAAAGGATQEIPDSLLRGWAQQLAELQGLVQQLTRLTLLLGATLRQAPVHLDVERLDVQNLNFHLGAIDIDHLSGELNIGLTHTVKGAPEPPADPAAAGEPPPTGLPPDPDPPPIHILWPPPADGKEGASA